MANYNVRPAKNQDIEFLWETLYQAIYVTEEEERPAREVLKQPDIEKYLCNWGRKGDIAYIATDEGNTPLGAV
ncbi:hypothetical protein [Bacillus sp. FJAT-50079]|uniref:hypothetical protein n=1 Tax=Bacillus sp. FJAT-50079 TaxID=2833577 RepID=UPI001BCA4D45|nr:hypothetical protein [Bacillus sp. FJAT-50079]MBS4207341.1 hypothetical protein [Bacillus sp. FJAT-50079]